MNKAIWVFVLVVIVVAGGVFALSSKNARAPVEDNGGVPTTPTGSDVSDDGEQVFCTQDAKMCPDGSYVGRVGPSCEFAACPGEVGEAMGESKNISMKLNEEKTILGVSIKPFEVLEDSRCPVDVTCVWAGTVRVKADMKSSGGAGEQIFILNEPVSTEAETVVLTGVSPATNSKTQIKSEDYVFAFKVTKR